jgi:hypothetical protein
VIFKFKLFLIVGFSVMLALPSSLDAGFFDKLVKDLEKNLPANGAPGIGSNQPNAKENKKATEGGKVDYSSSSIISFLCQKTPLPGLPTDPAPDPQLVADDFGKSIDETRKTLRDNFSKQIGPQWARSLPYYADAFDQTETKLLFNAFIASNGENLAVLSQIKQLSKKRSVSQVYTEEYADARFAYGLVLSHYSDFHKKGALGDKLISVAEGENQSGALYITAKKLYYGWSVARNVNKSANLIAGAHEKENFERATELWHKIALDPEHKYRNMYLGMAKQAAQIKASLQREINKKSGSVLRSRINRLNALRIRSLKKLAEAFDVAAEFAKIIAGLEDLQNQADPSQQTVEKTTRIGNEASEFMVKKMAKADTELDPKGQRLVKEAFDMNRQVISQLGATTTTFLTSPGSLSDMAALAPALDKGINASCQLNSGIEVYSQKKNITVEQGDIIPDPDDEFKA